jgi:hypothetical protein
MPMYFPDLKSVNKLANDMTRQTDLTKRYNGIIPISEEELPQARMELSKYMREIWHDEIFAMEIELAVDKDNYEERMCRDVLLNMMFPKTRKDARRVSEKQD